jgi:hypothetical protein
VEEILPNKNFSEELKETMKVISQYRDILVENRMKDLPNVKRSHSHEYAEFCHASTCQKFVHLLSDFN